MKKTVYLKIFPKITLHQRVSLLTDKRKKPDDLAMQAYEEEKAMLNGDKFGFDIEQRKYFTNRSVN